ncbi:MAG: DUF2851 family protein [Chlorobi bacterium]|nr:DUF2851 family protein [Chlorobiota bacterium]
MNIYSSIPEEFLVYLWKHSLTNNKLVTSGGQPLTIIHPGTRNMDSGPDFFNGRVKIGNTTWAGNIEIHVLSSDWRKHGHDNDPAYDNIILHVVYQNDRPVFRKNGELIPTLELKDNFDYRILENYRKFLELNKWIPCEEMIASVNRFDVLSWLDKLMAERLEHKALEIENELNSTKQNFQEVFYRKLAKNFGFKTNGDAFALLAQSLPLNILAKHKEHILQLEALLFGQAGMLKTGFKDDYPKTLKKEYAFLSEKYNLKPVDRKLWKFMRLRPANFPTIRISQFAQVIYRSSALLNKILETPKLIDVMDFLKVDASGYWNTHFVFDKKAGNRKKRLGTASIQLILINTIVPFLFVYGRHKGDAELLEKALAWLERLPPESNAVIRRYAALGIKPKNAMESQALIEMKHNYCSEKRCLECRIGHVLLNR